MSKVSVSFYAATPDDRVRRRLVTQNLLASAARFEQPGKPEPGTIDDLSTFIDLYCLYDKLVLMRDPSSEHLLDAHSSLFTLLKKNKTIIQEDIPSEVSKVIRKDAEQRLRIFLWGEDSDETEDWLADFMDPENIKRQMKQWSLHPEKKEHFSIGRKWLKNVPSYKDLLGQLQDENERRSTFFVARTFFYLAFANLTKYTFTPDAARSAVAVPVLTRERLFIDELLNTLKSDYKPHAVYPELEAMISPLSVIVYERAARKETIISEVEALREELASTREAIQSLEDEALNKGEKQKQKALKKWKGILAEVHSNFKGVGLRITREQALNLGEAALEIPNPKSLLKPINVTWEFIERIVKRGPVIEIHKLVPQLGSTDRVERAIKRLFK